jgi:hypothetical protein
MNDSLGLALFLAADRTARLRAEADRDRRVRAARPVAPARTFLGRRVAELRAAMPAPAPVAHDHVVPCAAC